MSGQVYVVSAILDGGDVMTYRTDDENRAAQMLANITPSPATVLATAGLVPEVSGLTAKRDEEAAYKAGYADGYDAAQAEHGL